MRVEATRLAAGAQVIALAIATTLRVNPGSERIEQAMAEFQPFKLERIQSLWEQKVEYNLSESGIHPLKLEELVDQPGCLEDLLATRLGYPEVNGARKLRELIANLYPGATYRNVLVTVGAVEANHICVQTFLQPGDEAVVMVPNYLQIWGLLNNWGMLRKAFHLRADRGWAPDLEELDRLVTPHTKLIAVCNPNNPTGYILTEAEMDAIVSIAKRAGAWILADEVYRGAERLRKDWTPTFWDRYDKVLATASTSKAFSLPGLRIGWVIAPEEVVDEIWMRHEYTTISASMLGNKLAEIALSPENLPRLRARAQEFLQRGYATLDGWLCRHPDTFSVIPPQASGVAFVRYHDLPLTSTELVQRLIDEKSVFVVPGDCFGLDGYLRIGFGQPKAFVEAALDRLQDFLEQVKAGK